MQKLKTITQQPDSQSSYFRVLGMSCPSCAKTIESAVSKKLKLPTIVDFNSNLIRVDRPDVPIELLRSATQKMGFLISSLFDENKDSASREEHEKQLVLRTGVSTFFSMWILILSLSRYGLNLQETSASHMYFEYAISILFLPILFFSALPFYRMAVLGARVKDYNIDTFITLEIGACVLLSVFAIFEGRSTYFDSLAMSLSLLLFGKLIFFKMQSNQSLGIKSLTNDLPEKVMRISEGFQKEEVKIEDINVGDCIEVAGDEFVAFDGTLKSNQATFDRTRFFGTSKSLSLSKGADVLAGYQLTSDSPAQLKVTKTLGGRELDRLYIATQKALIKSREKRSPSERWLDIFIRATPLVALTGFFVSFFWSANWMESGIIALSLLIILCPCAFAFGPPLAFGILRSTLAQIGFDLRSNQILESESPTTILFDKNGTLTQPRINVTQSIFSGLDPEMALKIAASVESDLNHPIAHAFSKLTTNRFRISDHQTHENKGVEAEIKGVGHIILGNKNFMTENAINVESSHGFVHLAIDGKLVCSFRLEYGVSDTTIDTLKALKNDGYELGVLTGDSNFESLPTHLFNETLMQKDCKPKEKVEFLERLFAEGKKVAYVGDGVNDSLIMARSAFSFSVLNASKAAMSSAAVNFLKAGITSLPSCLTILKRCRKLVKAILIYALLYNAIAVSFALLGFFNPATALLAMASSSLLILASLGIFYFYIQMTHKEIA